MLVRFRTASPITQSDDRDKTTLPLTLETGEQIPAIVERFGGSDLVEGLRLVRVAPEKTLQAVASLSRRNDVEFAEPNYLWQPAVLPDDTQFGTQWALKNTGQVGTNDSCGCQQAGTVGEDIDAELAWNISTGSNAVVVAVIDGGIDINHPDLHQNIWVNPGEIPDDGIDNDDNLKVDDVNGWDFFHGDKTVFDAEAGDDHGTHSAGIIGAIGNNSQGIAGVNWNVKILPVKVLGPDPNENTVDKIIEGYNYVRFLKLAGVNIRVTNNSYSGSGRSIAAATSIQALNGLGILFVAAARNNARDTFNYPQYPADYALANIISVAATNRFGQLAASSNFGSRTVHMGAPGREVLSTVPGFVTAPGVITEAGAKYAPFSGTSVATPHVAGAAALAIAANPSISLLRLRSALIYTSKTLPSLNGKTTAGRRLNLIHFSLLWRQGVTIPRHRCRRAFIINTSGRSVTIQWSAPGDDGTSGTAADYDFSFTSNTTNTSWFVPTTAVPAIAGTVQSTILSLPFRGIAGTIEMKTFDEQGNSSITSIPINVGVNNTIDPYVQSLSAPVALTTGGTALNVIGDDTFKTIALPFEFPYYGSNQTSVTVSTNGSLFFSQIPQDVFDGVTEGLDADASINDLQRQSKVAGLWDDLRTDRGGDIFMLSIRPTPYFVGRR